MEEKNTIKMTAISKKAFCEATVQMKSAEEAVSFLKNELIMRNVRNIIEKYGKGRDIKTLQKILVEGIKNNRECYEGSEKSGIQKDAVERRVRGWMNPNSHHMLRKKDAIEVAFLLQLDLKEADEFIALISEEKLHWRDVEELVYIYGLSNHRSYRECTDILQDPEIQEILSMVKDGKTLQEIEEDGYTEFVRDEVKGIKDPEELKRYIKENYEKLGRLHNTAYNMFMEMIQKLEYPSQMEDNLHLFGKDESCEKYTTRDILKDFLYHDIVITVKQKASKSKKELKYKNIPEEQQYVLDFIQKKIADDWPDEVSISKMKNRKMDITRKALMLLFLATDGDYGEYDYDYDLDEDDQDENAVFEDILERMNDMLFFCGYSALDPRNPFDWFIIYCFFVSDPFDIDPRILKILEELFRK